MRCAQKVNKAREQFEEDAEAVRLTASEEIEGIERVSNDALHSIQRHADVEADKVCKQHQSNANRISVRAARRIRSGVNVLANIDPSSPKLPISL